MYVYRDFYTENIFVYNIYKYIFCIKISIYNIIMKWYLTVILLPVHPAAFTHNFV